MWTERKPARGSHVPAFPPINSQTSLLQSSSRGGHQRRYPKSPPHASDSTPRTSSVVFKDGENLQCQYSLSQLTRRDEGITCSPSLFMQLEDRVAMLEQASRTHQEELVHVQAVVRGRQGSMMEDMRQLRSSMDVQGATVEVDLSSLREQLKRLGEEQGATRDGLARVVVATEKLDNTSLRLKEHTDSKVSELEAGLTEVKRLLAHLENERKRQEIWLKESFSQLQDQQLWLSRQTADSLQNIAMEMEGREKRAAADHAQLVTRVSSALKESKKECQEEGERVRESLGARISDLDKALNDECDARSNLRAELSSKIVAMWKETAEKVDKDISQLRASVEQKRQSMERAQSTMRDSLTLLEREGRMGREDLSTVLNAEITTRQEEVLRLQSQCARLQEVCRGSVAGLREALISLEERMEAGRKEVHSLEQRLVSEWQDMGTRILADVTARLSALHQHIIPRSSSRSAERDTQTEREKDLETREAATRLRQQELEHHEHWQRVVREEVESLHNRMQQNSNQLYRLTTALQELQLKLVGQIQQETNERFHAILDLRNEIANIQAQMPVLFESTHTPPHPPPTGHTPRHTNQPPVTHVQELPRPRGPKFARFVASNHLHQLQQRMTTGTDHEYSSMLVQTTHGTTKTPHYFELPRTGAVSIEEEGIHESYGSPDLNDTESEESVEVYQEPQLAVHRPHGRDLLETSPEPRSLHSSISESYLKRGKMPLSRVRAEQRYRIQNAERFHRHFPINGHFEGADHETQGTFTSAAPTPDSQQRVLLRARHPKEGEADGGEQEGEADGREQEEEAGGREQEEEADGGEQEGEQEEEADGGEQDEEADGREQEGEADGREQEEEAGGREQEEEAGGREQEGEADGGEQEEEADGREQENEEQSVLQHATSQTRSVQDSDGDAHDDIETVSTAGEISALTKSHQVTLDRPPSHGLDTEGPENVRRSGDSVVEDVGYSVQGRTPSFSSQLDAEQPYGGAGPGDSERASSSEGDLLHSGESDAAAQ